ncbi:TPA: hypothetical protein DCQ22_03810 [Candidatus Nomurabacteria bacterium]|nr:hypothetical protein [Candidatus Nomurabacteria bacterium]HBY20739.1 hypothetical protein [Clostridiales bacterium]
MLKNIVLVMLTLSLILVQGIAVQVQSIEESIPDITTIISTPIPVQSTVIPIVPTETPAVIEVPTAVVTEISVVEKIDNIPTPIFYRCVTSETKSCIDMTTPVLDAISQTLFMEAGAISPQAIADTIQLLDNAMRNAWDCWQWKYCSAEWSALNPTHIGYDETTRDIRERLVLYLLSRPYTAGSQTYPAWNGWDVPFPYISILGLPYQRSLYLSIYDAVNTWLETPDVLQVSWGQRIFWPASTLITNQGIMYDYASVGFGEDGRVQKLETEAKYIYRYTLEDGRTINMYYSTFGYVP